jgi:hypothetical protein
MAGKQRFTQAQIIAALTKSKGMVYLAAKRLHCDVDTILNYCKRYPAVERVKQAQRGEMVDLAEMKLYESIKHGEAWGIAFCLKTIGKDRGYVEQQKLALTDPSGEHGWEPTLGISALLAVARANGHALPSAPGVIDEKTPENH